MTRGIPGVDYAWSKPPISALKSAGEVFVAQYFSSDPTKNLTPARAAELMAAHIEIVAVWEYSATAMRGGKAQGQRDATQAEAQAKACGVDGIPVYFACDYDAPPGDQAAINGYLDGCASVLGDDRGRNIYGGYWPLSRAKTAGKARRLWGTAAWSGNEWATSGLVPDIMQGALVTVGGVACDLDAGLSSDFGQWPRPAKVATWQALVTGGTASLEQIAQQVHMLPSSVLRHTATHYGAYDAVTSDYVNGLVSGAIAPDAPVPPGARLWVRN
jgi:hypothetical protein